MMIRTITELDPLRSADGTPIETAEAWQRRRPELLGLFEDYMFGPWPGAPRHLTSTVIAQNPNALDGAATLREIRIRTEQPNAEFDLLLMVPNSAGGMVPCFLGANFDGNHTVVADPAVTIPHNWITEDRTSGIGTAPSELDRGRHSAGWSAAETIAAGYALGTFFCNAVVEDEPTRARRTLQEFAADGRDTSTVMTWGWALSRALDALQTQPEVDSNRVIAVGHSRLGKAALVACAFDQRFAAVIPSQAGCGGSAPCRMDPALSEIGADGRPTAETVAWITTAFPHWFAPRLAELSGDVTQLPFDQHQLIALCAPKPVLLPNAADDAWADPDGQFAMLQAAEGVYQLLINDGLQTTVRPDVGQISPGPLAYALRAGGHSMIAEDWQTWRTFADRWVR